MSSSLWNKLSRFIYPLAILAALGIRYYGSVHFPGQYYDINTYAAWGHIFLDKGPADFFDSTWSDYLPLPIYFCAAIVRLAEMFHTGFEPVLKLSISLLEITILVSIYSTIKSRLKYLLLPFLFLSPAVFGDSAFWGQLDTLPSLLTVLSLSLIYRHVTSSRKSLLRLLSAAVFFGLAVAVKPIVLLVVPVFALLFWSSYRSLAHFLAFGIVSFLVFVVPAIPVAGVSGAVPFLYAKASEQASTYPFTTVNAWNLWSVAPLGNSWPPDDYRVFGISANQVGLGLFAVMVLRLLRQWARVRFAPQFAFRVAAVLLVLFYAFTTRMHERHLLFGLPFLAVAAVTQPWLLIPLAVLTASFTLNLWGAYSWVNHAQAWPVSELFIQVISWVNVVTAAALAAVWDWPSAYSRVKSWLRANRLLALILLFAAFLRLVNLSHPPNYIFDEVYHSFTSRELIANHIEAWEWWTTPPEGVAYEWTHPPLAKYGMVLGMLLFGQDSFGWRVGSAVMGIVSILGLYRLVFAVFGRRQIATLAAFLLSIEGLHLAQSRVGMNDLYMLGFYIWALYQATQKRWKLAAFLFGLSLASKWSALYGVIPLGFLYLRAHPFKLQLLPLLKQFLHVLRLLLISLITYILTFVPFLTSGHTWAQWWELHRQMWYYHTHLVATHDYQSTPWEWIFSLRPVWYFVEYGEQTGHIYAQGNPVLLWLGLAAILILITKALQFRYALFYCLYAVFVIPWIFSPRIMFFYHYLPSAAFLTVILAAWLSELNRKSAAVILAVILLSFVLVSPVYYGLAMPPSYWNALFGLFPSWK